MRGAGGGDDGRPEPDTSDSVTAAAGLTKLGLSLSPQTASLSQGLTALSSSSLALQPCFVLLQVIISSLLSPSSQSYEKWATLENISSDSGLDHAIIVNEVNVGEEYSELTEPATVLFQSSFMLKSNFTKITQRFIMEALCSYLTKFNRAYSESSRNISKVNHISHIYTHGSSLHDVKKPQGVNDLMETPWHTAGLHIHQYLLKPHEHNPCWLIVECC